MAKLREDPIVTLWSPDRDEEPTRPSMAPNSVKTRRKADMTFTATGWFKWDNRLVFCEGSAATGKGALAAMYMDAETQWQNLVESE